MNRNMRRMEDVRSQRLVVQRLNNYVHFVACLVRVFRAQSPDVNGLGFLIMRFTMMINMDIKAMRRVSDKARFNQQREALTQIREAMTDACTTML